jgi:hypothetical protein
MKVNHNNRINNEIKANDMLGSKEAREEDKRINQLSPVKFLLIRLKEAVVKASTETTGHGIPKIIENKNIVLRIVWFIAVLLSVGGCAYLVYDSMTNFLSWNVVTTIKEIGETPSLFPVIKKNLI